MATLLYYGKDLRVSAILEEYFKNRKADSGEANSISVFSDDKKLEEALVAVAFDVLFFEQVSLPTTPVEWLETFRKKYPNVKGPKILVGEEADLTKIMKILDAGFNDYIVMPPDKLLLIEKVNLYATGSRNTDARQVYSLQMNQAADLAKPGIIEELSEFDCKVRGGAPGVINDLIILYSKAFGADGNAIGAILARCYKTEEHQGFKGQHLLSYYFVGVTTDILTNIRTALRKSYVSSKQK